MGLGVGWWGAAAQSDVQRHGRFTGGRAEARPGPAGRWARAERPLTPGPGWLAAAKFYVKKMNFRIEVEKLPDFYQGKLARVLVKLI